MTSMEKRVRFLEGQLITHRHLLAAALSNPTTEHTQELLDNPVVLSTDEYGEAAGVVAEGMHAEKRQVGTLFNRASGHAVDDLQGRVLALRLHIKAMVHQFAMDETEKKELDDSVKKLRPYDLDEFPASFKKGFDNEAYHLALNL